MLLTWCVSATGFPTVHITLSSKLIDLDSCIKILSSHSTSDNTFTSAVCKYLDSKLFISFPQPAIVRSNPYNK